nr:exocyst complex component EXO70H1-like [Lolium perenne]
MARLEDEFRHVLSSRAFDLEIEALADLTSLSTISGDRSSSLSSVDLPAVDEDDPVAYRVGRRSSYRSLRSIREIDLLPDDAVADLRAIASRMAAAGYGRECAQVYASVRKPAVDASLRRLGVERLSIGDVQRLEWDALEAKIRRWIRATRAAVRRHCTTIGCVAGMVDAGRTPSRHPHERRVWGDDWKSVAPHAKNRSNPDQFLSGLCPGGLQRVGML